MIGIVAEAWTSAISTWLRVSSVISHAAPTDWIIEPMLENRLAVQIARNAGWRNGASGWPEAVKRPARRTVQRGDCGGVAAI